jgi:uncharacterized circularly permuted ATP-grasp superfamily protein
VEERPFPLNGRSAYARAAHGIKPANGARVHVSGIDIVRDESGVLRVLEDQEAATTPDVMSSVAKARNLAASVAENRTFSRRATTAITGGSGPSTAT